MIRPIPLDKGVGFFHLDRDQLDIDPSGYDHQVQGRYHNYHFTPQNYQWPVPFKDYPDAKIVDGFSPNLNKSLHIGHLRNLAIANAFHKMAPPWWRFVAILGTSLGVFKKAQQELDRWFDFLAYHPECHYDALMPCDPEIVPRKPGTGDKEGTEVHVTADGREIVLFRTNKTPTYSLYDLAFAANVKPDYYITGSEQVEHFRDLGLGDKHLPMGLVLGTDKKKLASRRGDALTATEAMDAVKERFDETRDPDKLAWNVLAWNFLHVNRHHNLVFDPDKWTTPDSPGMYITYTYARMRSALNGTACESESDAELTNLDVRIMGAAQYAHYWQAKTLEALDTAPFANYVHELCRVLGDAYHRERIKDGRPGFVYACKDATGWLGWCMQRLGMFTLDEV